MADAAQVRSVLVREAIQALAGSSLASSVFVGAIPELEREPLPMSPPLSSVLPQAGFPRGSEIELASLATLGRGVTVALAACSASQEAIVQRAADTVASAPFLTSHTLHVSAVQCE